MVCTVHGGKEGVEEGGAERQSILSISIIKSEAARCLFQRCVLAICFTILAEAALIINYGDGGRHVVSEGQVIVMSHSKILRGE